MRTARRVRLGRALVLALFAPACRSTTGPGERPALVPAPVEAASPSDGPVLVFHVLDANGSLPTTALQVTESRSSGSSSGARFGTRSAVVTTDEQGLLRWQLRDPAGFRDRDDRFDDHDEQKLTGIAEQDSRAARRARSVEFPGSEWDEVSLTVTLGPAFASADRSGPFSTGEIDAGVLVLQPMSWVASGRVVDSAGAPVSGAEVVALFSDGGPIGAETDEAGEFALFSEQSFLQGEVRLVARKQAALSRESWLPVGASGIELVLSLTAGSIEGSVRLDAGIPPGEVRVHMEPDPGAGLGSWMTETFEGTKVDRDATFRLADLWPGIYALRLDIGGVPSGKSFPVVVEPGTICRDPHLHDIDLRGLVHTRHLKLVPERAGSELRGRVTSSESIASGPVPIHQDVARDITGPECTIYSPNESSDVTIEADGFQTVVLEGLRGDREVQLHEQGERVPR